MKKTNRIALGGLMAALSVAAMLMTGIVPMADFALPAIAGIFLVPVVVEAGYKAAWLCYGAAALLSILIAPMKECALYYAAFLGFYPIVKSLLEKRRSRVMEWVLKLLAFNACLALITFSAWLVFRFPGFSELFQSAWWVLAGGLLLFNAVFVVYDIALTQLISAYLRWFRPQYILKIFK